MSARDALLQDNVFLLLAGARSSDVATWRSIRRIPFAFLAGATGFLCRVIPCYRSPSSLLRSPLDNSFAAGGKIISFFVVAGSLFLISWI